ncbi:MAG: phosphatase [Campylobacterales bacterium]|nr:phosphatase [Campylobacterales bacterium]
MIAIDLGSNTLRVVELDCTSGKFTAEYEKIVKTADGLAQTGMINDEAINRVINAILEAKTKMDFDSQTIKAVTTQALRSAKNSDEVLARIKDKTDISFEIISGEEEANLTLLAVKKKLEEFQHASKSFVLIDIGGGSTELIFSYPDQTITRSFPIGIVTIAQSYETLKKIDEVLPSLMQSMEKFCSEVYAMYGKVDSLIATAGTPTTVAAMKLGQSYTTYDAKKINGTSLQKDELDFFLKKLLAMPFESREIAVGTGRSDLIAAGILIFKRLYEITEFEECIVIDDGLREGVALQECAKQ